MRQVVPAVLLVLTLAGCGESSWEDALPDDAREAAIEYGRAANAWYLAFGRYEEEGSSPMSPSEAEKQGEAKTLVLDPLHGEQTTPILPVELKNPETREQRDSAAKLWKAHQVQVLIQTTEFSRIKEMAADRFEKADHHLSLIAKAYDLDVNRLRACGRAQALKGG